MSTRPDRFRDPVAAAYDAIIVGAGMGGLVTAALLARAGKRVLALDGHYVAGGNATVFRRKRFEFDIGIHYLGDCGPDGLIPTVLHACGVRGVRFRPMDGDLEQLTFPDFDFAIPGDRAAFRKRLLARFPAERRGIERYFRFLAQVDRMQRTALSGSRWRQVATALRSPLVLRYANRSLGDFLASCTTDPQLRAVLTAQNGTYAIAPARVSAILHAGLQNHYFTDGGWYPEGGAQVMSDRLAEAIEGAGGQIRLRARVTRIHVRDGHVTGVTFVNKHLGTTTVEAPVVVSNADLKRTVFELVGSVHFPPEAAERAARFEMALPLFVVFLGLDVPASALPYGNCNRWVFGGYDFDAEYAMVARGEMPERPFVYIATASHKDPDNPRLAPPGHCNVQVMTVVPPDPAFWGVDEQQLRDGTYVASEGYRFAKEQVTARVLAQAERAIPGLARHVVFKEAATPLTHTRYTGSTGGTSYGIAATPAQFLRGRPPARTPIGGLYLAGASTRAGHGIVGAMLSGVHAASSILRDGTAARILARWSAARA
jgi:phytoene dehydrogenase-like protein